MLDDAAFGGATPVEAEVRLALRSCVPLDRRQRGPAFYRLRTNYLIDLKHAVIMDVEATTAVRQAEVTRSETMIDRTHERFGVSPERLAADTGYGSAEMLAWLVDEHGIEPHIPVFDKSERTDGTFERADFIYDQEGRHLYLPGGKQLRQHRRPSRRHAAASTRRHHGALSRQPARLRRLRSASHSAARTCRPARSRAPSMKAPATWPATSPRPTPTSSHADERKKVEMLFAHLKRILKLDRLRLRGPNGARDEFLLAATAQNLRKLAKLIPMPPIRPAADSRGARRRSVTSSAQHLAPIIDFFNTIRRIAVVE